VLGAVVEASIGRKHESYLKKPATLRQLRHNGSAASPRIHTLWFGSSVPEIKLKSLARFAAKPFVQSTRAAADRIAIEKREGARRTDDLCQVSLVIDGNELDSAGINSTHKQSCCSACDES
jgi:hypothetical protein